MPTEVQRLYEQIIERRQIVWHSQRNLECRLGRGGQGMVFLSRRNGAGGFDLPVALKIFSPAAYADSNDYRSEMGRIARVSSEVAHIQHDNLVDVQNLVEIDGVFIMEMEWIDGCDLRRLMTLDALRQVRERATEGRWEKLNRDVITAGHSQPRVKPRMAIAILRECLAGLSALHRVDIVHNDVKPSNIMLKRSGNVKLIDIGLAFSLKDVSNQKACTPEYAAPEVMAGQRASTQSDLASLGYLLLEIISGVQPFARLDYKSMLNEKVSALASLPRLLPTEEFAFSDLLIPLLRKLLHPDPKQRFRTAEEAEHSKHGAAAFEQELIRADFSIGDESDIREWVSSIESNTIDSKLPSTQLMSI